MKNVNAIEATSLTDASMNLVLRHLGSFQDNDLKTLLSDYTEESVLITQEKTYKGPKEIETFFKELIVHFPRKNFRMNLDNLVSHGSLVYIVWHAKTPSLDVVVGSDTFLLKEGKISEQTFVGQLKFTKL